MTGAGMEPSPQSGKEAGLQFPHQSGMEQGTEGPGTHQAEHPLGREAQPSILPAPRSCRQSSLPPYVSPFLTKETSW